MSTLEPDLVEQLMFGIELVKLSDEPFTSKIAEMDRLVDLYTSRLLERRASVHRIRAPAFGRAPERSQGGSFLESRGLPSPPSPLPRPTFASQFGDIVMYLDATTVSFLRTAEDIASYLQSSVHLDWSAPVILLCKAFERETVRRILEPLRLSTKRSDLSNDLDDLEFNRIAKFCRSTEASPPELGTFGRFLATAIHSVKRRNSSALLQAFYQLVSQWPESTWIVDPHGLAPAIERLTKQFRNRAAHIEQLMQSDFIKCHSYVRDDPDKIIVRLVVSTQS
jgi:hypothetical protein